VASGNTFEAFDQKIIYTLIIAVLTNDFLDHGIQRKIFA
jgi:hypothetical protein